MNYELILGIDPSGSFYEGKGTTGWCILNATDNVISLADSLHAKDYAKPEIYWDRHLALIKEYQKRYQKRLIVVMEDYVLYATKASDQINSRMETCKLIGIIQHFCWMHDIPYEMQLAAQVKNRWTDTILEHKRYIKVKGQKYILPFSGEPLNRHCKDAIRHAVHYANFKNKGESK